MLQLISTAAVSNLAYISWKNKWGLLNHTSLSPLFSFFISYLLLDLKAYGRHLLFHKIPFAWRFHQIHHSDLDVDVTTGQRFHPGETLISFVFDLIFIVLIGPSFVAVFTFDSFIFIFSFINHANIRVFPLLDKILRWFVITPEMHRVHHSIDLIESNSNFGFMFPWWDYLFRTYLAQPAAPHEKMRLGLAELRSFESLRLPGLLMMPFRKKREEPKTEWVPGQG